MTPREGRNSKINSSRAGSLFLAPFFSPALHTRGCGSAALACLTSEPARRLARYRGQRGGNHLRASFYPRKIDVTELSGERACYSGCKQRFSNSSNLLNIQVGTSFSNNSSGTASTKEDKKPNSTKPVQKSKLNIAHLNIRSLKNRTHLIQLKDLVLKNKYDVFAVSESWLNSSVTNAEVSLEGYKIFRLDRTQRAGGGVCVYIRNLLRVNVLKDLTQTSTTGFQQLWLHIQHKKLRSFLFCAAYRPPNCPVNCFIEDFTDKYIKALTIGKEIIVAGDLNCDLLKINLDSTALVDLCTALNLKQLISTPTRVTEHSSTLIDVIMTSNSDVVSKSGVLETCISDHFVVYLSLNLKLPKPPPKFVCARSYRHYNPAVFNGDLSLVQWEQMYLIDDVNEKLDFFNGRFLNILEVHAPIKNMRMRNRRSPFVNKEIKALMSSRDTLHKIARRSNDILDWERYRSFRGKVKSKLKEAERDHVQKEIKTNNNKQSLWKTIRGCLPRKEQPNPVYTKDVKHLANEFNEFFTSGGANASIASKKLAEDNCLSQIELTLLPTCHVSEEFYFQRVTSCDLRKVIQSFPSNKAPGWDKVSMSIIKDSLCSILPVLSDLVNSSLLTSVFPDKWKKSEVIPLVKEGDNEIPSNNRPISLLPALSKICERVALNQFTEYLTRCNRLTNHQSGNKKSHSTETLNIFITDTIFKAMDSRRVTALGSDGSFQGV